MNADAIYWVVAGAGTTLLYVLMIAVTSIIFGTDDVKDTLFWPAAWMWPIGIPFLLIMRLVRRLSR